MPVFVSRFGDTPEEVFVTAPDVKRLLGADRFKQLTIGALGVYSYFARLTQGVRQLMAGNRKFNLDVISRDDVACLTRESAEVTGLPYITEVDAQEVDKILG